ncbi:MAG: AraC family transcriptional regulator [Bacteroidia bacterium]|nr:AraC family transcriptional regulator [Bacteroidia bacterium]
MAPALEHLLQTLACGALLLLALITGGARGPQAPIAAKRWLSLFLLSAGCLMLDGSLYQSGVYAAYPHLLGITDLFVFTLSPALYLSVRHFTDARSGWRRSDLWHLLPAGLFALLNLYFFAQPLSSKLEVLAAYSTDTSGLDPLMAANLFQHAAYLLLSFRRLVRHRRQVTAFASSLENVRLDWLWHVLLAIACMYGLWVAELLSGLPWIPPLSTAGYLAATAYLGYHAVRQDRVFGFSPQAAEELAELLEGGAPPEPAGPPAPDLGPQKAQLAALMAQQQPYLDSSLSLPALAQLAGMRTHDLSRLINQGFGENFYQFVNRYRIEASKRLLADPAYAHYSILGIAFEAGFNSKTTFNTAFKQATGAVPAAWRREALAQPEGDGASLPDIA